MKLINISDLKIIIEGIKKEYACTQETDGIVPMNASDGFDVLISEVEQKSSTEDLRTCYNRGFQHAKACASHQCEDEDLFRYLDDKKKEDAIWEEIYNEECPTCDRLEIRNFGFCPKCDTNSTPLI